MNTHKYERGLVTIQPIQFDIHIDAMDGGCLNQITTETMRVSKQASPVMSNFCRARDRRAAVQ